MPEQARPSISAVVATYQAERFIGPALESILGQTRPPDEVVVVDDGSTDATAAVLERFDDRVRVVRQPNRGYPAAMNRAVAESSGDWVALCGADDLWEPRKLEWQEQAILTHPEVDVLFGHAVLFGAINANHPGPAEVGVLDSRRLLHSLFRLCLVCAPSVALRRSLYDRLGPFRENFDGDDYDYWFRCLRAGARFYFDPRRLVNYRRHDANVTNNQLAVRNAVHDVHRWHADMIDDPGLVREVNTYDLFRIARLLVEEGQPAEARQVFRRTLRYASPATASTSLRALAWTVVLSLPEAARAGAGTALVTLSRAVERNGLVRRPAVP
ncbi:MAG TPA: glycosyltransferase [Solirubrobacteraceae bacterium]|nr:glycosyltransferase [Solirubrobacteraceae bacterium]